MGEARAGAGTCQRPGLGRDATEGWPLVIVLGSYGLYVVAVVALFVEGVALCRRLFALAPALT